MLLPVLSLALSLTNLPPSFATGPGSAFGQQRDAAGDAARGAQPERAELPSYGDDIDRSIRWLRGQQDRASGAYGGSIESTALVLIALAESPRAYRASDGPFVADALEHLVAAQREDGAIADPNAMGADARRQTRRAAQALTLHFAPSHESALERALATLPEDGPDALEAADPELDPVLESIEQATALGAQRLAGRLPDGSWPAADGSSQEDARGSVRATALAVIELARLDAYLAPYRALREPGSASALPAFEPVDRERALEAQRAGARFLVEAAAAPGRWGPPSGADPGITAMVLGALQTLPEPRPADVQRHIDAGLEWLVSLQNEDGSIHAGQLANYVTSASLLALVAAEREAFAPVIDRARRFLQVLQADEGEGYSEGDRFYGGIGYGGDERPDLSNLQLALEALAASGLEAEDPTFQKALRFLERCQNRSESNDLRLTDGDVVIASGDDGGAAYMPGSSKAGYLELADGTRVPRSYGSMTYALLKCYVFAGLERDDPRLQAAWEWCQRHYTLDVNPGFAEADPSAAYQGLFYYFLSMARALDAYGAERITDAAGREHAWRAELCGRLVAMQSRLDGSWKNHNASRWLEGNPLLATAYALQAIDTALPPKH